MTPVSIVAPGCLIAAATGRRRVGVAGIWVGIALAATVLGFGMGASNVGYEGVG